LRAHNVETLNYVQLKSRRANSYRLRLADEVALDFAFRRLPSHACSAPLEHANEEKHHR
jgi:hypothetical protein